MIAIYRDYISQHTWYTQHGDVGPLIGFGIGAASLLGVTLALLLVARAARSWFAIGISAGATGAFAFGVILACTYKQPSIATAKHELTAGNLIQAQEEAQALVDMHRDTTEAGAVLDDLHLRRARDLRSLSDFVACVREPWHGNRGRSGAEVLLRARVQDTAAQLYAKHDTDGLASLNSELGANVPDISNGVRWLIATVRGGVLLESSDIATASAQLEAVVKLAEGVPQSMRPSEAPQIAAAATKLIVALSATNARSPRERITALATAAGIAREYARLVGMDSNTIAQGFSRQQREATRALARAERLAQQQKAERDSASKALQQSGEAAAGSPIDPYPIQSETGDGTNRQQDKRQ